MKKTQGLSAPPMLAQVDPLTKFIAVLCITILVLWVQTAWVQAVIFGAVAVIGVIGANRSFAFLLYKMRFMLWVGIPFFLLQLLWIPGETVIGTLGPLTLTVETLDFAAAVTIRLWTLMLSSLIYMITTEPSDVVLVLAQKLRVPYRYAFAVSIALRFLPMLSEEAALIRTAQQIRGMRRPKGLTQRVGAWQRFAAAVFLNCIRRVQMTANSMDAKGFGAFSERTYMRHIAISRLSVVCAMLCLIGTVVILWML